MGLRSQFGKVVAWVVEAHLERRRRYVTIADISQDADTYSNAYLVRDMHQEAFVGLGKLYQSIIELGQREKYFLSQHDIEQHIHPVFDKIIHAIRHGELHCKARVYERVMDGGHCRVQDLWRFLEAQNLPGDGHGEGQESVCKTQERYVAEKEDEPTWFSKLYPLATPSSPVAVETTPTDQILDIKRMFLLSLSYCAYFHCRKNYLETEKVPFIHQTMPRRAQERMKRDQEKQYYRGMKR